MGQAADTLKQAATDTAAFFTGGATGEQAVSGGNIQQGLAADVAGLAAGSGIAASGLAGNTIAGAGATGASSAGATLMPAAVPETAESLAASGLVETSPGVWEALKAPQALAAVDQGTSTLRALRTASTILAPAASVVATGASVAASRKASNLKTPTIAPPTPLPSANTISANRAAVTEQLRRRGRAATILTGGNDSKLGG